MIEHESERNNIKINNNLQKRSPADRERDRLSFRVQFTACRYDVSTRRYSRITYPRKRTDAQQQCCGLLVSFSAPPEVSSRRRYKVLQSITRVPPLAGKRTRTPTLGTLISRQKSNSRRVIWKAGLVLYNRESCEELLAANIIDGI